MLQVYKKGIAILTGIAVLGAISWPTQASLSQVTGTAEVVQLEVNSVRHTRTEDYAKATNNLKIQGFKKVLEDDKIAFYIKEENAAYRIVDKKSGYVWGGLSEDDPEDMNKTWSDVGNSLVTMDILDKKATEKTIGIKDAKKKYTVKGNTLELEINHEEYGIAFTTNFKIEDGKVIAECDLSTLVETGKFLLENIYFMPFLGSTRGDEQPGYVFIPDGVGALMRFKPPTNYLMGFEKRVYGADYAIDDNFRASDLNATRPNDFLTDEGQVYLPVYGIVHGVNQNAMMSYIQQGDDFAAITVTPSGLKTNYNWATTKFIVRQRYLQPTSKNGSGVQVAQKQPNKFIASVVYEFLRDDQANYVGMAVHYREILQEEGSLSRKERVDTEIPMQLDFVMGDMKKGFLSNKHTVITTIPQVIETVDDLQNKGIRNLSIVLKGWQKGGLSGHSVEDVKLSRKVGTTEGVELLGQTLAKGDGRLYYYENPVKVTKDQMDIKKYGAHGLSQMTIQEDIYNDTLLYKTKYYLKPTYVVDTLKKNIKNYKNNDITYVAFDGIGNYLYADLLREKEKYRDQVRESYEEILKEYDDAMTMALYSPNMYLYNKCSEYFGMELTNSQYQFETDTVPFLPIVLKGSLDYYAPYGNEGLYSKYEVLKMIEYGAYPSFLLTGKPNYELSETASNQLFSTNYTDWANHIEETYSFMNKALSKVEGKQILDRQILEEGIVKVSYEEGICIYINYTVNPFRTLDGTVESQSYLAVGGGIR